MEAQAALQLVKELWQTSKVWVKRVVSDGDSSIRSILHHSYKSVRKSGLYNTKQEEKDARKIIWPQTASGKWVADNGKLPLEIYAVAEFLCDFAHRKNVLDLSYTKL